MIRLSFLGIFVSISILAAAGQVSAEVDRETVAGPPKSLTGMQKTEWQIGNFAGWIELCGYNSKAAQIIGFMKKSPYFRKGVMQLAKYDRTGGCGDIDKSVNPILELKEKWEQYLDVTYPGE